MARGINKVILLYEQGMSIPQVSDETGLARSTIRYQLKIANALRSRADGVREAARNGRLGSGMRSKRRTFSNSHKKAISDSRQRWAEENSKGTRISSSGYIEFTRGAHKGRSEHVVKMEERLGRPLMKDECVHHIDGNKLNNDENNLALLTTSGHARLHRREEALTGNERERNENGTWS